MKQITAEIAFANLHDKKSLFVDVRTPEEYERAHIEGALSIPLGGLAQTIQKMASNKNQRIYVYCLSGSRSIQAATIMDQLGYTDVNDMQNGLLAWRFKKYPLVS